IGMEGGVLFQPPQPWQGTGTVSPVARAAAPGGGQAWLINCCVTVDRHGQVGESHGLALPLPRAVAAELQAGGELGPVMDRLTGARDAKGRGGAIAHLTGGLVTRQQLWEQALAAAL